MKAIRINIARRDNMSMDDAGALEGEKPVTSLAALNLDALSDVRKKSIKAVLNQICATMRGKNEKEGGYKGNTNHCHTRSSFYLRKAKPSDKLVILASSSDFVIHSFVVDSQGIVYKDSDTMYGRGTYDPSTGKYNAINNHGVEDTYSTALTLTKSDLMKYCNQRGIKK